jgi:hypothetical protein
MPKLDKNIPICPVDGTHGPMFPNLNHEVHRPDLTAEWYCMECNEAILVPGSDAREWMLAIHAAIHGMLEAKPEKSRILTR